MGHSEQKRKKVMVFGVFDRLHPGHISLLEQAARLGDELLVVVARDETVEKLKRKTSHHTQDERMRAVKAHKAASCVILGDEVIGAYEVIKTYSPDVICLGYDQQLLEQDLRERMGTGEIESITLVIMDSYGVDRFHTSLLTEIG